MESFTDAENASSSVMLRRTQSDPASVPANGSTAPKPEAETLVLNPSGTMKSCGVPAPFADANSTLASETESVVPTEVRDRSNAVPRTVATTVSVRTENELSRSKRRMIRDQMRPAASSSCTSMGIARSCAARSTVTLVPSCRRVSPRP